MSDIAKIINESIAQVIGEGGSAEIDTVADTQKAAGEIGKKVKKFWRQSQDDMSSGKAAQIAYDKLHPEKKDEAFETVKKLAKKNAELENMGVGEHLSKAGKKAVAAAKDKAEEIKAAVGEHPGLAAATAAALAAGVGGLAAVKKMRSAAKK